MTTEQAQALRQAFKPEQIGKLPRLSCPRCREAQGKACAEHPKAKCPTCGNYISPQHIHLDYVGHAATTDRLLAIDPEWTWEPMAVGPNGEPLIVNGGLWIRLTVAGVTRPGFGDGANPKEIISDAIRNAAMRFGVALDLWAKEDLRSETPSGEAPGTPSPESVAASGEPSSPGASPEGDDIEFGVSEADALRATLISLATELGAQSATEKSIGRNRAEHTGEEQKHVAWLKRQIKTAEKNLAANGGSVSVEWRENK